MIEPLVQISRDREPPLHPTPHDRAPVQMQPRSPGGPTLADVFNAIWRRKAFLILSNLVLGAIAFVMIKTLPPAYTAVAEVMIDPRRQLAAEADPALAALRLNPDTIETLESEVQVIKSADVLQEALDRVGPVQPPAVTLGPGVLCGLLPRLPEVLIPAVCANSPEPEGTGSQVDELRDGLEIKQIGFSRVVGIAYSAPDPVRAAEVANAVAAAYVEHQSRMREGATESAKVWLNERIPKVRAELEQAREALERHRVEEALVDGRDADLLREQIAALGLRIGELRAEYQALQSRTARAEALVKAKGPVGVFEVVGNSWPGTSSRRGTTVAEEHRLTLAGLRQRRQELERELGPRHPEMMALSQQIAGIENELQSTAVIEFASLVNESELAAQQLAAAEDQLAELRSDLSSIAGAEIQLRSLEQEAEAKQAALDVLLERARQFSDLGYDRPVAWTVSRAAPPPDPDAPNKWLLFAVAALAGAGLTLGLVLLLELRERRYALSLDALKRLPNAEALAILPVSPVFAAGTKMALSARKQKAAGLYAEAMRRVHGSLSPPGLSRPKIVLVSSAESGEGKTTFAGMLGRTATRRGQRVLVMDCDFLRPALHRMFRLKNNAGLGAYFRSPEMIQPFVVPGEGGPDILTTGGVWEDTRDTFFRQNIAQFLSNLTVHYNLVILDTPPVLAVADAKLLAPFADDVLLVVKWKATTMAAVRTAIDELHEGRNDRIKVVLNQVDLPKYASYNYNSYPAKAVSYSYAHYHSEMASAAARSDQGRTPAGAEVAV